MGVDFFALGQRIQRRRKSLGRTQENLAEAISVTTGYISQIERGITKINLETLSGIAEYLGCDIAAFLSDTATMSGSYLSGELEECAGRLSPQNRRTLIEIARVLEKTQ